MSIQITDPKTMVHRIYDELWNQGKLAVADEIFVQPEGVKRYIAQFLTAFPDLRHTVETMIAEGETVAARFSATGTHTGSWHGIAPTHQKVTYTGVTLAQVRDGKIVAHSTIWDTLGLLEQLGLVPMIRKADGSRL